MFLGNDLPKESKPAVAVGKTASLHPSYIGPLELRVLAPIKSGLNFSEVSKSSHL